ncbi:hypothetical protein HDU96_001466 [Phlyctochytrium bullatum]|nr:hypothetical protein HDU96_001466 [Phlyctochytrium bullatum]
MTTCRHRRTASMPHFALGAALLALCMAPLGAHAQNQPKIPTATYPIKIVNLNVTDAGISGEVWVYQQRGMVPSSNYYVYAKIMSKDFREEDSMEAVRKGPVPNQSNLYAFTYSFKAYSRAQFTTYALIGLTTENAQRFYGVSAPYFPDHNQQTDNILGEFRDVGPNYPLQSFNDVGSIVAVVPSSAAPSSAPASSSPAAGASSASDNPSVSSPTSGKPGTFVGPTLSPPGSTGGSTPSSAGNGGGTLGDQSKGGIDGTAAGDVTNSGSTSHLILILGVVAGAVFLLIFVALGYLLWRKRNADKLNEELITLPWKKRGAPPPSSLRGTFGSGGWGSGWSSARRGRGTPNSTLASQATMGAIASGAAGGNVLARTESVNGGGSVTPTPSVGRVASSASRVGAPSPGMTMPPVAGSSAPARLHTSTSSTSLASSHSRPAASTPTPLPDGARDVFAAAAAATARPSGEVAKQDDAAAADPASPRSAGSSTDAVPAPPVPDTTPFLTSGSSNSHGEATAAHGTHRSDSTGGSRAGNAGAVPPVPALAVPMAYASPSPYQMYQAQAAQAYGVPYGYYPAGATAAAWGGQGYEGMVMGYGPGQAGAGYEYGWQQATTTGAGQQQGAGQTQQSGYGAQGFVINPLSYGHAMG